MQPFGNCVRRQERTCLHQVQEAHGGRQEQDGIGGAEHGSTGGGGRSECKPGRTVAATVAAFIRTTHARGDRASQNNSTHRAATQGIAKQFHDGRVT